MGYYIRVLGTQDPDIHFDDLLDGLREDGLTAKLAFAKGEQASNWTILQISNEQGDTLTQVERNPVIDGTIGKDEIEEFKEEIEECKPTSAVQWLTYFFKKVKVIYAFQILNAAFADNNFEIISSIRAKIRNRTGGILQADYEGFSNDEGFHILWKFSDDVNGEWSCAVLNSSGQWENFMMDLGDKTQRQEFLSGKVPQNANRL